MTEFLEVMTINDFGTLVRGCLEYSSAEYDIIRNDFSFVALLPSLSKFFEAGVLADKSCYHSPWVLLTRVTSMHTSHTSQNTHRKGPKFDKASSQLEEGPVTTRVSPTSPRISTH